MTRSRLKQIRALAARVPERKARELYEELMGAWPNEISVPVVRVRASLVEAADELLAKETT